jgi:hypothetical protein
VIEPDELLRPLLDDGPAPEPTPVTVLRDRARRRRRRRHALVAAPAVLVLAAGALAAVRVDGDGSAGDDVVIGSTPTDDSTTATAATTASDAQPTAWAPPTSVEPDGTVVVSVTLLDGTVVTLAYDAEVAAAGHPLEALGASASTAVRWGEVRSDMPEPGCCGRNVTVVLGAVDDVFAGRTPDATFTGPLGSVRRYPATATAPSVLAASLGPWTIVVEPVDLGPYDTSNELTAESVTMLVASLDAHVDASGYVVLDVHDPLVLHPADSPDASLGTLDDATRVDVFARGCPPPQSRNDHGMGVVVLGEPGTSVCATDLGVELVVRGDLAFQELVAAHVTVREVVPPG